MKAAISIRANAVSDPSASPIFRWLESGESLIVGRSPQKAELVLRSDSMLSGEHFCVECDVDQVRFRDLGSTNGTLLNNVRSEAATLSDGDILIAGCTTFQINIPAVGGVEVTGSHADVLDDDFERTRIASSPVTGSPDTSSPQLPGAAVSGSSTEEEHASASKSELLDGWDLELNEWPEPLPAQATEAAFAQNKPSSPNQASAADGAAFSHGVESGGAAPQQANVVLMIHDDSPIAQDPRVSRAMAWVGSGQSVIVGRKSQVCDWAIAADDYLSAQHFRLTNEAGKCSLENLSKTNGTWLNGYRIESALLRDQDLIRAGQTTFQISVRDGVELSDIEVRTAMVFAMGERDY